MKALQIVQSYKRTAIVLSLQSVKMSYLFTQTSRFLNSSSPKSILSYALSWQLFCPLDVNDGHFASAKSSYIDSAAHCSVQLADFTSETALFFFA